MFFRKHVPGRRSRKIFFRRSFGRKNPPGPNRAPLLLAIGLALAIVYIILPLGAEQILFPGNWGVDVVRKALGPDYFTMLSGSLPGLAPPWGAEGPDQEDGACLHSSLWQDYPRILLSNELAGLQVSPEATRSFSPPAAGEDSGVLEQWSGDEEGNPVFLTGEKTGQAREKPFILQEDKPLLLIYHTHTSESFQPVSGKTYAVDPEETVVFLGVALTKILQEKYNIPVLHHREVFDRPRSKAYQEAAPAIEKLLRENPQIEVVLDLHRDGVPHRATTANISGEDTARVLFVIETRHQRWSDNLRFALFLENILQDKFPGFSRGILKRICARYNQHLHPRSLIVEIGGHENSREELLRAIPLLAEALGETFR